MVMKHEDWCRHLFNEYSRSFGKKALKFDKKKMDQSKRLRFKLKTNKTNDSSLTKSGGSMEEELIVENKKEPV
jgi:hypothetical protein